MSKSKKNKVFGSLNKYVLGLILLAMFIGLCIALPNFLRVGNIMTILRNISMQGIIAFGMTMVIITGEIDLSVGSQVAFSGCLCAWLVKILTAGGMAMSGALIIAVVVTIALAYGVGVFTALLRYAFNVPSFISTLAFMTILKGGALLVSGGYNILSFDTDFAFWGAGYVANVVPFPVVILIVVFAVLLFILKYTKFGREIYATGGNVESARLNGVNIRRVRRVTLGTTQALAAVSGILVASQILSGNPTVAVGWEMTAISAVIIGGASLAGGKGSISGTLIGMLFLGILLSGMTQLNVSSYWQDIVRGILVLVAVLINNVVAKSDN